MRQASLAMAPGRPQADLLRLQEAGTWPTSDILLRPG